jgi:hypothetical protein
VIMVNDDRCDGLDDGLLLNINHWNALCS